MPHERPPIFSPKFPLRSISFSQMTKIFRSGASLTIFSCKADFTLSFLPLRRPSFSKFLNVQAIHRRQRPGVSDRQSASQTRLTKLSSRGDPYFHARACSGAPHFHARAAPEPPPPFLSVAAAHTYQNVGRVPFPPPPPPGMQNRLQPTRRVASSYTGLIIIIHIRHFFIHFLFIFHFYISKILFI